MPSYQFLCAYEYLNERRTIAVDSLSDVKDGFWLDENLKFTKTSAAHVWIPPHRILCVVNGAIKF